MILRPISLCAILLSVTGCTSPRPEAPASDAVDSSAPDLTDRTDAPDQTTLDDTTDAPDGSAATEVTEPDEVPASTYCERTVDLFCPYYLRCGRMAVDDLEGCKQAFLEACNARYEPLYIDLERRGLLALSRSGITRCRDRLETVDCASQIFDLDGCPDVWLGKAAEGAACGPGLESFICGERATCLIDLDFCGTCVPLAPADTACDLTHRCPDDAVCRDGACLPRTPVGAPCDASVPCVLGARCDGVCVPPTIVALGEACDTTRRCPYKSSCVASVCEPLALLGEPCDPRIGCASGACDPASTRCVPLAEAGAPCTTPSACQSGRCTSGRCDPIAWSCQD
jgi:hypothetical protein